jgi:hypothetical protein
MYSLSQATVQSIEYSVKLPFERLVALDPEDEALHIKAVRGSEAVFSTQKDIRKPGRGNPLLSRRRFRVIEYVEKRLAEIVDAKR